MQSARSLIEISHKDDLDKDDELIQNSFKPVLELVNGFISLAINSVKSKNAGPSEGLRRVITKFKIVSEMDIKGLPKAYTSELFALRFRLIHGIALFTSSIDEEYDSITASAELLKLYKKEHVLSYEIPNILKKIITIQSNRKPRATLKMREYFDIFTDESTLFGSTSEQISEPLKQFRLYSIRIII